MKALLMDVRQKFIRTEAKWQSVPGIRGYLTNHPAAHLNIILYNEDILNDKINTTNL